MHQPAGQTLPQTAADLPAAAGDTTAWNTALILGACLTFCVAGYQFGGSNHTVYLLDALRSAHPELLRNDWFTTQTLQYHAAFAYLARWLMRAELIRPAFFAGYLGLLLAMHWGWTRIVRALGGTPATYLLGVAIYCLLLGGVGLGFFSIEQDGAFLPSNIASVATLCAIALRVKDHVGRSWLCVGLAGIFHLNYAVTVLPIWAALDGVGFVRARKLPSVTTLACIATGTLLCLLNVAGAWLTVRGQSGKLPLDEFVALYARLRHPHHMDVRSWPIVLWVSFLVPVGVGVGWMVRRRTDPRWQSALDATLAFCALMLLALCSAGFWFWGETFVQMQWYRFSVFPKLLGCVACAFAVQRIAGRRWFMVLAPLVAVALAVAWRYPVVRDRAPAIVATLALLGLFALFTWFGRRRLTPIAALLAISIAALSRGEGLRPLPTDDPDYVAVAHWARDHTPTDAVFLVPPGEQSFRLEAGRAIVINFKAIPQLSGELREYRKRLTDVLGTDPLSLQGTFNDKLREIDARYNRRPLGDLRQVAEAYGATYIVTAADAEGETATYTQGPWRVYLTHPALP